MNYRKTYSWKMTLELMPGLVRLSEELPSAEEQGLRRHLGDAAVGLVAAVAQDLEAEGERRREQLARLEAVLAVVEVVYPAIDAAEMSEQVGKVRERLTGQSFGEEEPDPAPEPLEEPAQAVQPPAQPLPASADAEAQPEPEPAPTHVNITPVSADNAPDV